MIGTMRQRQAPSHRSYHDHLHMTSPGKNVQTHSTCWWNRRREGECCIWGWVINSTEPAGQG